MYFCFFSVHQLFKLQSYIESSWSLLLFLFLSCSLGYTLISLGSFLPMPQQTFQRKKKLFSFARHCLAHNEWLQYSEQLLNLRFIEKSEGCKDGSGKQSTHANCAYIVLHNHPYISASPWLRDHNQKVEQCLNNIMQFLYKWEHWILHSTIDFIIIITA